MVDARSRWFSAQRAEVDRLHNKLLPERMDARVPAAALFSDSEFRDWRRLVDLQAREAKAMHDQAMGLAPVIVIQRALAPSPSAAPGPA